MCSEVVVAPFRRHGIRDFFDRDRHPIRELWDSTPKVLFGWLAINIDRLVIPIKPSVGYLSTFRILLTTIPLLLKGSGDTMTTEVKVD